MLKFFIAFALFISTVLHAEHFFVTPKEQEWLNTHKTITVRIAPSLAPFQSYGNGGPTGIAVDYIKYIAQTLGITLKFTTDYTWTEALERVQTRDGFDVALQAMASNERAKKILFSKPYTTFSYALLTHKASIYPDFFDSSPKKIALVKHFMINERIKKDFPSSSFTYFDTNLEAMKAVNANTVDAYIGNSAMMTLFMKEAHLENTNISSFQHYAPIEQSVITSKDWPEFISLFDKVLSSMSPEEHIKIKRKHIPMLKDGIMVESSRLSLSKEEKAYISKKRVIKVSNETHWAPYDFYENGEAKGYGIELIEALSKKIGLHVEYVTDTWPFLLEKFQRNEIDLLHPVFKTKERETYARFSEPFITIDFSLVTQSKHEEIKTLQDLKNRVVGVSKGWASTPFLKESYPESRFIEYETTKEMLEAIAFGIIDAGIDDYFASSYLIKKEQLANLRILPSIMNNKEEFKHLYIMFQKEEALLQGLFNKALKSLQEEEFERVRLKWIEQSIKKKELFYSTQEEQNYLSQKGVIKMCIDPDWMPLETNTNGQHVGIAADYIKLMETFIGIPIQMVPTKTWIESLARGKDRTCDIFSLVMPTPQRRAYLNFTKPYLSIPLVLVGKLDKIFYSDIGALSDKKIGITKGYAYGEILRVRYPNMQFIEIETESDGLKKVEEGKLFGTIGTLATTAHEIQKKYFGSLKIIGKFDETWELGVGARNDEPHLVRIFDKAIDAIEKNESQNILNRWISVTYEKGIDYSLLYKVLAAVLFLGLIFFYRHYQLRRYSEQLEILSNTDKLTGIANRLKLDDILEYEKKIFDRYQTSLSIIMFDLDFFKQINDNYGHKTGDDILKTIGIIITELKRDTDIFGRWGGEEFLIICPNTDVNGALVLAEKFRLAIESYEFERVISLTASFGVASFERYESIEKVFHKVDKALYDAKENGRNKVYLV